MDLTDFDSNYLNNCQRISLKNNWRFLIEGLNSDLLNYNEHHQTYES